MKRIFIYDLDDTVIDSKHRVPYKPNGDLDLTRYYASKDMIVKDTLLPLINTMRHQYSSGHKVFVCTSRVLDDRDYASFQFHNVPFHTMLSRPDYDKSGDADLKRRLITSVLPDYDENRRVPVIMYEDNKSVLDMLPEIGIIGVDSVELNRRFQREKVYR